MSDAQTGYLAGVAMAVRMMREAADDYDGQTGTFPERTPEHWISSGCAEGLRATAEAIEQTVRGVVRTPEESTPA
jgi:hypothetical protein